MTTKAGLIHKAVSTPTASGRAAAYTKLAPLAPTQPVLGAARRYMINISSDALDHDNDRVLRGAVDAATTAPVPLLVAHDYSSLPIGTVSGFSYTDAGRLRAQAAFPAPGVSARADEVVGLIEGGVPVQYSLGFKDLEKEGNAEGGFNFSKIRLMEVSVVPVGASPGTGTLSAVKMALLRKRAMVNDGQDPTRDPVAMRTCPYAGAGGRIGGAAKGLSAFDKRAIPPVDQQMGHCGGEAERRAWAMEQGLDEGRARERDAETRAAWNVLKNRLLALDPRERPVLRPFIDISRTDLEAMPADVQAVACGHLDLDSDLNGA
jgi:HK97 family phage prohead protease